MATFQKANDWVEKESELGDLDSDQFVVALSNTAPGTETNNPLTDGNGILANVTQIAYTNLSTRNLTLASSVQVGGVYVLDFVDLVLTSTGGTTGPFRYIWFFDDTIAGDPVVGVYDIGSEITIGSGGSRTLVFHEDGWMNKT